MAASGESNEVLLTLFFNGKEIDSRPFGKLPTLDDLADHSSSILTRRNLVEQTAALNHRITKFTEKFGGRYVDIDDVSAIENGDQIGIYSEEVDLIMVDPAYNEEEEQIAEDSEAGVEDFGQITPPIPSPAPTPSPVPLGIHASRGYTHETVKPKYRPFLYSDNQLLPVDEAFDLAKESEALKVSFTETNFQNYHNFDKAKKLMIRAIGDWLIRDAKQRGRNVPSITDRSRMAFSVWAKYPWYGSDKDSAPLPMYVTTKIYDPLQHNGPLEFYINRQIAQERKAVKKLTADSSSNREPPAKMQKSSVLDQEAIDAELRILNRVSGDDPKALHAMDVLLEYRRHEIKTDPTLTPELILSRYPSFVKNPELIIKDFKADQNNMADIDCVERWDKCVDFILTEAFSKTTINQVQKSIVHSFEIQGTLADLPKLSPDEKSQLTLLMLPCLLTPSIQSTEQKGKTGKTTEATKDKLPIATAIDHLVQFKTVGPGRSLKEVVEECKKDVDLTQPFLLCLGPRGYWGEEPTQIFLVINFRTIQLPSCKISQAVHYLFASFHTFNMDYPKGLKQVYMFLEKLFGVCSTGSAGRATDLYDRLRAHWKTNNIVSR